MLPVTTILPVVQIDETAIRPMVRWIPPVRDFVLEAMRYVTASRHSRWRQNRTLRALDDRLLADIGVSRLEARCGRALRKKDGGKEMMNDAGRSRNIEPASDGHSTAADAVIIRDAEDADIPAIQEIYAQEVLHGLASFEEVPPSTETMRQRHAALVALGLPFLAAEMRGSIVGYSYAAAYRPRPAYRATVENTVYVANDMQGRGIGRALLEALIARCEAGPWRQMIAVIGDSENTGSIRLHARLGFRHVGTLEAVGFKLGRWVDSVLMQRPLGAGSSTLPDLTGPGDTA